MKTKVDGDIGLQASEELVIRLVKPNSSTEANALYVWKIGGHKLDRFYSLSNRLSIVWRRPFGAGWLVNGGERSGIRLL